MMPEEIFFSSEISEHINWIILTTRVYIVTKNKESFIWDKE